MNIKQILAVIIIAIACIHVSGCTEPNSNSSRTDIYVHQQPNSADALQAVGELAYQVRGKANGVTNEQHNSDMKVLGVLGILSDFAGRK